MRRLALVVLLVSACSDSDEDSNAKRCERVRDRIVDLRLENATNVDRDAHRIAMRDALGADFVEGCQRTMTAAHQRCVLDAKDLTAASACNSTR